MSSSKVSLSLIVVLAALSSGSYATPNPASIIPADAPALLSRPNIADVLHERLEENGIGIVVGLVDDAGVHIVSAGHSGDPDVELDGHTVFQMGSVTKGITSLLLADMVIRGEVALDDPAGDYLPDGISMPRKGRPITLRDLAQHTSGLPSLPTNIDLGGMPDPNEAYSVDDLYAFLSEYKPDREPREKAAYSNLGVALLGRLLGDRLGMSYEKALKERVLEPLGMMDTSINLNESQASRLAIGHDRYGVPVRTMEMKTLQASGSLRSTADDLLKMIAAYTGHADTSLADAMALQIDEKLGWGVRADGTASHSGGKAGYRSAVTFDVAAGKGVVVLANARNYDRPMALARHFLGREELSPPPARPADRKRIIVEPSKFSKFEGRYKTETGDVYEVAVNEPELLIRYPNTAIYQFAADTPTSFYYHGGDDDIEFVLGSKGEVVAMKIYGDGRDAGGFDTALPK